MMYESLARKLRVLRAERGLTLDQVEELTGVRAETVSQLERGMRRGQSPTLHKIAKGYGVPVSELMAAQEESTFPKGEAPFSESEGRRETVSISAAGGGGAGAAASILAGIDDHFDAIVEQLQRAGLGEVVSSVEETRETVRRRAVG